MIKLHFTKQNLKDRGYRNFYSEDEALEYYKNFNKTNKRFIIYKHPEYKGFYMFDKEYMELLYINLSRSGLYYRTDHGTRTHDSKLKICTHYFVSQDIPRRLFDRTRKYAYYTRKRGDMVLTEELEKRIEEKKKIEGWTIFSSNKFWLMSDRDVLKGSGISLFLKKDLKTGIPIQQPRSVVRKVDMYIKGRMIRNERRKLNVNKKLK